MQVKSTPLLQPKLDNQTVLVQEIDQKNQKVVRTFARSLRNARMITKSIPDRYVILELASEQRMLKEPTGPELIKKINEATEITEVQQYALHDLKTVRQAAIKKLDEMMLTNNAE